MELPGSKALLFNLQPFQIRVLVDQTHYIFNLDCMKQQPTTSLVSSTPDLASIQCSTRWPADHVTGFEMLKYFITPQHYHTMVF